MPKKEIPHLALTIDGVNIEKVEEFNFLGLTIDTNLKWKKHTDKISNKCSKITGVLNRLKLLFPQEIKCLLYNSLIVPHINYCITAWGFYRNRITIIQKKAIRIITASSYISHTEPLFKQLNLLKVEDILTLHELKFYFKYNQGILQNIYKTGILSQIQKYITTTLGKLQHYTHSKQNMNLQKKHLNITCPIR